jgi:hypothetical protein
MSEGSLEQNIPDMEEVRELILSRAIFKEVKEVRPLRKVYFSNESLFLFSSSRKEDKLSMIYRIAKNEEASVKLCFSESCDESTTFIMSRDGLSDGKVKTSISYMSPLRDFVLVTSSDDELRVFLLSFDKKSVDNKMLFKIIVEEIKEDGEKTKKEYTVGKKIK